VSTAASPAGARRRRLRLALAALLAPAAAILAQGCPSRDLEVQITSDGANTLVTGCESFRAACSPASCHKNRFLCDQTTCALRNACILDAGSPTNPDWEPDTPMGMRVLLIQTSPDALTVLDASACVPLNLRPCILDPTEVFGCKCIENPLGPVTCGSDPTGDATLACVRDTLAQTVERAMGTGTDFSGFTSPDSVTLVAAFYQASGTIAPCDGGVLVNPTDCATGNLSAVAGLGAPSGGSSYDITCASCQGGTHESYGPDNAPCPVTTDDCFLQRVSDALQASGQ
jgi:hypothetical protein